VQALCSLLRYSSLDRSAAHYGGFGCLQLSMRSTDWRPGIGSGSVGLFLTVRRYGAIPNASANLGLRSVGQRP
jgi:hypothetical protein